MRTAREASWRLVALAAVLLAAPAGAAGGDKAPAYGPAEATFGAHPAAVSGTVGTFVLLTSPRGPQAAITLHPAPASWVVDVGEGGQFALALAATGLDGPAILSAEAQLLDGPRAEVELAAADVRVRRVLAPGQAARLELRLDQPPREIRIVATTRGGAGPAAVRWRRLRVAAPPAGPGEDVPIRLPANAAPGAPPPVLPPLRPAIQREMIEADWRMQDGLTAPHKPAAWAEAVDALLRAGGELIADLQSAGVDLADSPRQWEALRRRRLDLPAAGEAEDRWEDLWRQAHRLRRRIALANPLAKVGPILFVKRLPATFSHQLTQYYGRYARPGGGVFVLEDPGGSMACRQLGGGALGGGSYQHPEVSYDAGRVLFAFCPADGKSPEARRYHLYEMAADGSDVRRLTDGPYDDFSPRYLPEGRIVFVSTRRGGYHRCGSPGCPVYTLTVADADGSGIRLLSYHETQEWDPAVLHDGRIIYTRWDYVDRHAVFGEHLWTTRPDGTGPSAFYGNLTRNPVGTWEAQPVPGSAKVMATAAAHHAMTSGSIVLVDVDRGADGLAPLTRLTRDVPFPESEFAVGHWFNPSGVDRKPADPLPNQRWPGHSYRTPWPLSERYFLAAYSFDALIGEPRANRANLFGLYLVDAFGNKELLYRDMNVSSLWPVPLRPRKCSPALPSQLEGPGGQEGTFVVQNVYAGWPPLEPGSVRRLRITQVLPKTTQGRDNPAVGLAGGSPGKQVLGTVPVEADGSAHFVAPAGVPLLFQALDERGQAVQIMRSATYLQPGERASCVGCHEPRTSTSRIGAAPKALARAASRIQPAPDGAMPFSFPLLVQGVLDRHCIRCHSGQKPPRGIDLTGRPAGHYTASYNALAPRVPASSDTDGQPLSYPGRYGARGSRVMKMLLDKGHNKVVLSAEDIERLATWMDTNALFYGTFDPAEQSRQQQGQRIGPPALQ